MFVLFVFVVHKSPETIGAVLWNETRGREALVVGVFGDKCEPDGKERAAKQAGKQAADGNLVAHTIRTAARVCWDTALNLYISLHMIPFFAFQLLRYHFR